VDSSSTDAADLSQSSTSSSDKEPSVQDGADADDEDEGDESDGHDAEDEEEELRTPSSVTVASADEGPTAENSVTQRGSPAMAAQVDVSELAREFGIEAHLVQALAARLNGMRQT